MSLVISELSSRVWQQARPTNYSTNGFPTKIPTLTAPSGTGVVAFGDQGPDTAKCVLLVPYGTGSSTNTFLMKCLGWRPTDILKTGATQLWVPSVIGAWTVTIGTGAGVANADLGTASLFATTIVPSLGPTLINSAAPNTVPPIIPDYGVFSPGSNDIGLIIQRSFGFRFLEFIFSTGGSATDCNTLYCKM